MLEKLKQNWKFILLGLALGIGLMVILVELNIGGLVKGDINIDPGSLKLICNSQETSLEQYSQLSDAEKANCTTEISCDEQKYSSFEEYSSGATETAKKTCDKNISEAYIELLMGKQLSSAECWGLDLVIRSSAIKAQMSIPSLTSQEITTQYAIINVATKYYKSKNCSDVLGFVDQHTDTELTDLQKYCYNGSYAINAASYKEITGKDYTGSALQSRFCAYLPFTPISESNGHPSYVAALFAQNQNKTAGLDTIDYNNCSVLNNIAANPDNKYRLTEGTKKIITDKQTSLNCVESKECSEGPAYTKTLYEGCKYDGKKGIAEIDKYLLAYSSAHGDETVTDDERIAILKKLQAAIQTANKEIEYNKKDDEVNAKCTPLAFAPAMPKTTQAESSTLNEISNTDLKCCSVGKEYVDGACKPTAKELGMDTKTYLTFFKSALDSKTKNLAAAQSSSERTLEELNKYESKFDVQTTLGLNKTNVCSDIKYALEKGTILEQYLGIYTQASKSLQCCTAPGYYTKVSDNSDGTANYSCATTTTESLDYQLDLPECKDSTTTSYILIGLSKSGILDNSLYKKDSNKLIDAVNFLNSEAKKIDIGNSCNLPLKGESSACNLAEDRLKDRAYKQSDYTDEAKKSLSSLMNDTLKCCLYEKKPWQKYDIFVDTVDKLGCKDVAVDITIQDTSGNTVYTGSMSSYYDGVKIWDGTNKDGNQVYGSFTYNITFKDGSGDVKIGAIDNKKPAGSGDPAKCTENTLSSNDTKMCIGGVEIECIDAKKGTKSTDKKYVCDSTNKKWIAVEEQGSGAQEVIGGACSPNGEKSKDSKLVCENSKWAAISSGDPANCTENTLSSKDTKMCIGGVEIECIDAKKGTKSTDKKYVCDSTNKKWIAVEQQGSGDPAKCTENTLSSNDTKMCIGGVEIECTDAKKGTKSTDEKYVCDSTNKKWIAVQEEQQGSGAQELVGDACTPNGAKSKDSKLVCEGGKWKTIVASQPDCTTEGSYTADGLKKCVSGKWVAITGGQAPQPDKSQEEGMNKADKPPVLGTPYSASDYVAADTSTTPPGLTSPYTTNSFGATDNTQTKTVQQPTKDPASKTGTDTKKVGSSITGAVTGTIKITKLDAFPKGFNPLLNDTKITYKLSNAAKVELKITDSAGVTVVTLIDNQEIDNAEHFVWWDGTNTKDKGGTAVKGGTYSYKLTAFNPVSGKVEDSKSGQLTAIVPIAQDFEGSTSTPETSSQVAAKMSVQNATSGVTAGTGPEALLYLLFPAIGLAYRRYKK